MKWNWQKANWPHFAWDPSRLARAEDRFLMSAGVLIGTAKHLGDESRNQLIVDAMSREAITTSAIEGEILNRDSVQSSIQRQLGLFSDKRRATPAEAGISELMVDLYRSVPKPLSQKMLFGWHRMVMAGRKDLRYTGRYRTSTEPMQVVSGPVSATKVHFEAPPSVQVPAEMTGYLTWFNRTAPNGAEPLPALTRAGIAHLYFESIHPFEDGNGRIGRAIAEKALVQGLRQTILVGLGTAILANHRGYYDALEAANKSNEITPWLTWFACIAIEAQSRTSAEVEFLLEKTRLLDRLRDTLNDRQRKVLLRMFAEGPSGFKGGLSAGNYSTISGASPATTTRDLADLTAQGALLRTGQLRHARYELNILKRPIPRISIDRQGSVSES
jgi:Fic family protein